MTGCCELPVLALAEKKNEGERENETGRHVEKDVGKREKRRLAHHDLIERTPRLFLRRYRVPAASGKAGLEEFEPLMEGGMKRTQFFHQICAVDRLPLREHC